MAINKRIRKDGSVSYQVVVDEYDPVTRKRKRHTVGTFSDLKRAKREQAKAVAELSAGKFIERSALTVTDVITLWIESKRGSVRASSIDHYEMMSNGYIIPALGSIAAQSLAPLIVQSAINNLTRNGSHYATASSSLTVLSSAFNHAVRMGIVPVNPTTGVVAPKNPGPTERVIWSEEDVGKFITAARSHTLSLLWLMLLETGARRGEVLGLRWSDVDWDQSAIRISSTAVQDRKTGKMYLQPMGKTDTSRRVVLISDDLVQRLRAWRKEHTNTYLVFEDEGGEPLRGAWLLDELTRLCTKAGVERVTVHGLRHLAATRMMRAGIPLVVAQQRMGHSSSEMLRKVYQHADAGLQREAVERLAALSDLLSVGADTGDKAREGTVS